MTTTKNDAPAASAAGTANSWLTRGVAVFAVAVSAYLLYRTLSRYDFAELVASIEAVSLASLAAAIGWAAASYLCLTLNDRLALSYVGRPLPYSTAARTSFVALSFGHNIGFAALSSGAIRYRFYSQAGVSAEKIAKIVVFCGITIFLGMFTLGDIALFFRPDLAEKLTGMSRQTTLALGLALILVPVAYIGASVFVRRPIRFFRWTVEPPETRIALAQLAVGTTNFLCVAACLHETVSAVAEVHYFEVLSAFVLANTATIIVHAPGGLGVIETVVLHLLDKPNLIGAVLVFRFVYFLLPLALGAIVFATTEMRPSPRRQGQDFAKSGRSSAHG